MGRRVRTTLIASCVLLATTTTGAFAQVKTRLAARTPAAVGEKAFGMEGAAARAATAPVPPERPEGLRELLVGDDGVARPAAVEPAMKTGVPASCLQPSPLAPEAIQSLIVRIAGEEEGDARLAIAVARQESGFDRNRVSPRGALGPMQLMPATAETYGVTDACDPEQNVRAGIKHLKKLTREFQNPFLILAAYNAGERRVYEHKGVPPLRETIEFVSRITNEYYGFANTVIRPVKGASRPPAAGPARTAMTADAITPADSPEATGGPRWIGGHVLNID